MNNQTVVWLSYTTTFFYMSSSAQTRTHKDHKKYPAQQFIHSSIIPCTRPHTIFFSPFSNLIFLGRHYKVRLNSLSLSLSKAVQLKRSVISLPKSLSKSLLLKVSFLDSIQFLRLRLRVIILHFIYLITVNTYMCLDLLFMMKSGC